MRLWRGAMLVVSLGAGVAAAAQGEVARIPPVHGSTLSGEMVELPQALRGRTGVLVVGFSEASRGQATAWGRRLAGDFRDSKTVAYYEVPVLEGVPRLLRGWVLKKIAADVSDAAKPHFVPVVDHEREWKAIAVYAKPDDAYVLVVDAQGGVRGRLEGEPTDAAYAQVKRMVAEIGANEATR